MYQISLSKIKQEGGTKMPRSAFGTNQADQEIHLVQQNILYRQTEKGLIHGWGTCDL